MTIFLTVLAVLYSIGFTGVGTLIWLMGGSSWKAVPDAIIVGAVWPYIIWDWTR